MSSASANEEPGPVGAERRLTRLMQEFRRRQSERPDMVVRPWWTASGELELGSEITTGFVVEYCPRGVESAELAIRRDRVRVEGPGGLQELSLDLSESWRLAGDEVTCPELMVNHLLAVADRLLGEAA